jgi:hypothetical protein
MENSYIMLEFMNKHAALVGDRIGGLNYFCVKLTLET